MALQGGVTCWLPQYLPQGGLLPQGDCAPSGRLMGAGGAAACTPHPPRMPQLGKGAVEQVGKEGRGELGWGVLQRDEGREENGDPRKAYVHPRAPGVGRRGCGGRSGRCPCARSGAVRLSGGARGRTGCGWSGRCCPWGHPAGAWGLACGAPHREPPASPLPEPGVALPFARLWQGCQLQAWAEMVGHGLSMQETGWELVVCAFSHTKLKPRLGTAFPQPLQHHPAPLHPSKGPVPIAGTSLPPTSMPSIP